MRWIVLAMTLLFCSTFPICMGSYQLGSYSVDFNLSAPGNYTVEAPLYRPDLDIWIYELIVTPKTGGYISVGVAQRSVPYYNSALVRAFANSSIESGLNLGIGKYSYGMTTYRGHEAFEESYPAQIIKKNETSGYALPETYTIMYQIDELTEILIQSVGAGKMLYHEVLDSMNITKSNA